MHKVIVILYNIRSAYNVGSIFRTADAAGVQKLYLVGHTPTPIDRFGRKRKDIAKVALGAEDTVAWEHGEDIRPLITKLRQQGVEVVAVEQDTSAHSYQTFSPQGDAVFILGNEVEGLPQEVLTQTDAVIDIPMRGAKESLNVSVTAGIILFQFCSPSDTSVSGTGKAQPGPRQQR